MGRPRTAQTGLPKYCYAKKGTSSYYMKLPGPDGTLRMKVYGADKLQDMLADWSTIWGGAKTAGKPLLMGQLFDTFILELKARVRDGDISQTTVDDYLKSIRMLRPVWEAMRIRDVDAPAIWEWRTARGAQSRVRCNRERSALSEAFKLAIRKGVIKTNPCADVAPFKEKPRTRFVTDDEFMAVYNLAPPIVQAAMILAAITGLRQGDILRIKRRDFSVNEGLTVPTRKTGQPMIFNWTEGLKHAVLVAVGARDFVPLVLLSTQEGKAYTSDGFRTFWQRAMTTALDGEKGKPPTLATRYTFNDLRAKAGSESVDWKLLGHLDQRTFERVYNRLPRTVTPNR